MQILLNPSHVASTRTVHICLLPIVYPLKCVDPRMPPDSPVFNTIKGRGIPPSWRNSVPPAPFVFYHSFLPAMRLIIQLAALAASLRNVVNAQNTGNSTFLPARPPAIPLAVKSPYLSTWQQAGSDGGNGGYLAGQWPVFWPGQIVGWAGLVS